MPDAPGVLYHYTCDHGAAGITRDGQIRPGADGLIWLTDLAPPAPRLALGLTSFTLDCDRMAYVFTVARSADTVWWMHYRRADPYFAAAKEDCPGVMPMHWWIAQVPLPLLG